MPWQRTRSHRPWVEWLAKSLGSKMGPVPKSLRMCVCVHDNDTEWDCRHNTAHLEKVFMYQNNISITILLHQALRLQSLPQSIHTHGRPQTHHPCHLCLSSSVCHTAHKKKMFTIMSMARDKWHIERQDEWKQASRENLDLMCSQAAVTPWTFLIKLFCLPNSSINSICKATYYSCLHSQKRLLFIKISKSSRICLVRVSGKDKTEQSDNKAIRDGSKINARNSWDFKWCETKLVKNLVIMFRIKLLNTVNP